MISGYLFYRTRILKPYTYGAMIKDKLIRLGIPYVFFITIALIYKLLVPGVTRQVELSAESILMGYLSPFDGPLQEMWFVATIFLYFVLRDVYKFILKN